jgi:hypothetical protein
MRLPIPIATFDPKSPKRTIYIGASDLQRSMYVVGKTGTGKSALLERVALGAAASGFGVCVIDPHGDLADRLLGLVPSHMADRVVRIAPKDSSPVGLNLFAPSAGESRALVASSIIDVFRKLWGPVLFGPRSEHIVRNGVLALFETPGTTIPCLARLLVDDAYRARIVSRVRDPVVRLFWTREFPSYGRGLQSEAVAPVLNKLGALLSPAVRRVIGQAKPKLSILESLNEGRVVIADLSGVGRDAAQTIGALLVAAITIAAESRAGTPKAERRPFLLIADEFHAYTTASISELLSEGRKFGLSAVLAHQFTHQLPKEILAGILGNAGTLIAFRLSAEDAETLGREFAPDVSTRTLVALRRHRIALRLLRLGEPMPGTICRTIPPGIPSEQHRDRRIRASRERYGRRADLVDREVTDALGVSMGEVDTIAARASLATKAPARPWRRADAPRRGRRNTNEQPEFDERS